MNDILQGLDLRFVETEHALSALKSYMTTMENEVHGLYAKELNSVVRPANADEEEVSLYFDERQWVEDHFQDDFVPMMRYSFIVFLHTILEDHLRRFCNHVHKEKGLSLKVSDLRGESPIDRSKIFLGKLAGFDIAAITQWQSLQDFQKVRDCIVHSSGFTGPMTEKTKSRLQEMIKQDADLTLNRDDRLIPSIAFCRRHLEAVEGFFHGLFAQVGWKPYTPKALPF